MGPVDAVRSCLRQYATGTGRARRSEYWWFQLAVSVAVFAVYLVGLVLAVVVAAATGGFSDSGSTGPATGIVGGLVGLVLLVVVLATLVPAVAVTVRRLHDTGRSGWWWLLTFVPFGGIVLLVFTVMESTPGPNQYGPSPKPAPYGYGQAPQGQVGYGQQGYDQGYGQPYGLAQQPTGTDPR